MDRFSPLPISHEGPHDSKLDPGIAEAINILRSKGVETFESCESGEVLDPERTCWYNGCWRWLVCN